MKKVSPEQMLKVVEQYADNLNTLESRAVFVGLPSDKVGGKIYEDSGLTIIRVGSFHEFGAGNNPQRSFLRVPFITKKADMAAAIGKELEGILLKGRSAEQALGRIGIAATNISKGAFRTKGYGVWQDIKAATKRAKGKSQPLIDTGTLRSSITWVVRDAS